MAASSWRKWLMGYRHSRKKPVPRRAFVLRLESLEDRTVLSTYWVNTSADTIDSNPKVTSLREAIEKANGTPGVADIIRFKPLAWGTITLDEDRGQLEIADNLKIIGPGADLVKVSGGDKVRWPAPQKLFQSLRESSRTLEGARRTLDVEEAEAA